MNNRFSGPVIVFHEFSLPEKGTPVGYAALIDAYNLPCPFPTIKMAIGTKHTIVKENDWHLLTPRYQPENSVKGHLAFALKYEGVDLCVLKKLFELLDPNEIRKMVQASITGAYSRRIWFFYEWLMGKALDLPDAQRGNYVHALDPLKQLAATGKRSMRHRVVDNLPGTPDFCPLIRRTEKLDAYISMNLREKALLVSRNIPKDVVARAAAFLLLKDSQASFAIENETPPHDRIMRWGNAIRDAGKSPISKDALVQLQKMVIGDSRFVKPGYRETGGFVGEHDRDTGMPVVEHFSAKHEDIDSLIDGLVAYSKKVTHTIDAVCAAAAIAFGFVYIHPFVDGNGRIHRYLIHHILAENGYNPPGMIFPVSSSMLNRIAEYEVVLRDYSQTILPFIKWETTKDHNIRVLNDTIDYYRYFDATAHAVFLYQCVKETIEHEIPEEAHFLVRYDTFRKTVQDGIEMPDTTVFLLYNFLSQNGGKLSKRAQEKEFHALSQTQIERFEQLYARLFIE